MLIVTNITKKGCDRLMNKTAFLLVLLCTAGAATAGEIEIGHADYESLNPFCH